MRNNPAFGYSADLELALFMSCGVDNNSQSELAMALYFGIFEGTDARISVFDREIELTVGVNTLTLSN